MSTLAKQLRAAADRLEKLDKAAPPGPWRIEGWEQVAGAPWFELLTNPAPDEDSISAAESVHEASAELIATLRPLALVIAKQLWAARDRMEEECLTELDYPPWHRDGCGLDIGRDMGDAGRCTCFDHPLALADAILGAAS